MGKTEYLPIINKSDSLKLKVSDICMIYKDNRKLKFDTDQGEKQMYGKLDKVEKYLGPEFVRCMSGRLINMDRVTELRDLTVYFDNGQSVRLGKDAYLKIKQRFNAYLCDLLPEREDDYDKETGKKRRPIQIFD